MYTISLSAREAVVREDTHRGPHGVSSEAMCEDRGRCLVLYPPPLRASPTHLRAPPMIRFLLAIAQMHHLENISVSVSL